MSEHTKEPWSRKPSHGTVQGEDGANVAQMWVVGRSSKVQWANARRIVACVNFCAGVPTEVLETTRTKLCEVGGNVGFEIGAPHERKD